MLALETPPDTGPPVSAVETRPVRLLFEVKEKSIAEALAEGYRVPEDENREEFDEDRTERLGWYWAYDDSRRETAAERKARYLADARIIPMKGFARVILRGYRGIKDLNFESDNSRDILAGKQDVLTRVAESLMAKDRSLDIEEAQAVALLKARRQIRRAMPARLTTAGITPIWQVKTAFKWGRDTRRLNNWYEYEELRSGGRPVGAKTRSRPGA